MIGQAVKIEVERRSRAMAAGHRSLLAAQRGGISSQALGRYLESLRYLLSHTPIHLRRAVEVARSRGLDALAQHFEKKIAEEEGHDKWAESDLAAFGAGPCEPLPAVIELVEFLGALLETDPRLYAVYIVTNEYFTVVAGSAWVRALNEGCGVPAGSLSAVTKHIEADAAHAAEGFQVLDELIADRTIQPDLAATVENTMGLFSRFFDQVALPEASRSDGASLFG